MLRSMGELNLLKMSVPGTTAHLGCKPGDGQWQSREVYNTKGREEKLTLNKDIHTGGTEMLSNSLTVMLLGCQ